MELVATLTPVAQWLTDVFFSLDKAILAWYHSLALAAGGILTPIADVISYTGWKGALFIVLGLVMLLFRKTRKTGICCLLAIGIGALFANVIIKPLVQRPRPYDFDGTMHEWWSYAKQMSFSPKESDFSFPSGHMNAACAFSLGVVATRGKKWAPWALLYVVLMGMSRNFLIVHYPSDVLFAFVTGTVAGLLAFLIVRLIYKKWGRTKFLAEARN